MYLRYDNEYDHHHTSQQTTNAEKRAQVTLSTSLGPRYVFFSLKVFFRYTNIFLATTPTRFDTPSPVFDPYRLF
jgi:hypothetical protein